MIYKCAHFGIKELVSPIVYKQWGEQSWMFFMGKRLEDLDKIRERHGAPIVINNWATGGPLSQCGLRSNMDELVRSKNTLYLSAHCLGCGFDLHCAHGHNKKLFEEVYQMILHGEVSTFHRLESFELTKAKWVHVDGLQSDSIIFY